MNILLLVKNKQQKQARLKEAQRLAAKCYRGVAYEKAVVNGKPVGSELTYRNVRYVF